MKWFFVKARSSLSIKQSGGGWFIVSGTTGTLPRMHILCVLMELGPPGRSISKISNIRGFAEAWNFVHFLSIWSLWSPSLYTPSSEPHQGGSLHPFSFSQTLEAGGWSSSEGVFVVKLTRALFTKRMSREGLCPRSTLCMTHSFVMRLVCTSSPAKSLSWPWSQLAPDSPDTKAREKHRHKMAVAVAALFSPWVNEARLLLFFFMFREEEEEDDDD